MRVRPLRELALALFRAPGDLVQRRARRGALQIAKEPADVGSALLAHLVDEELRHPAVASQRREARLVSAAQPRQVCAAQRLLHAAQPAQSQAAAPSRLQGVQAGGSLDAAQIARELAGGGAAQQAVDARVQLAQVLELLLAQRERGGLRKRATDVHRLGARCLAGLACQLCQRRAPLFQQLAEGLEVRRAPGAGGRSAHLGEDGSDVVRAVDQLLRGLVALEPREDCVHAGQMPAQLAGVGIGQRAVRGGAEAAQRLLQPAGDAVAQLAVAVDGAVEAGIERNDPQVARLVQRFAERQVEPADLLLDRAGSRSLVVSVTRMEGPGIALRSRVGPGLTEDLARRFVQRGGDFLRQRGTQVAELRRDRARSFLGPLARPSQRVPRRKGAQPPSGRDERERELPAARGGAAEARLDRHRRQLPA